MKKNLFFKCVCPKCDKYDIFNIINVGNENNSEYAECFVSGEWREYDYDYFSISSFCKNCRHFVCGSVSVVWDEEKNKNAALSDFSSPEGELLQNSNLFINFDVPPLIPHQHYSSPLNVNVDYLYVQAKRCYKINAWDAVVILCRKIIDIQSDLIWRSIFKTEPISNLSQRVIRIFAKEVNFDKEIPVDEQLDLLNPNHRLLYSIEQIRVLGNFAAHSSVFVDAGDAETALI